MTVFSQLFHKKLSTKEKKFTPNCFSIDCFRQVQTELKHCTPEELQKILEKINSLDS